jgi:hypothetical protein
VRHTTLVATLPRRFAADLGADPALILIAARPRSPPVSFGMAWHPASTTIPSTDGYAKPSASL